MGHDGMLYSLPSRDLIADSVEYMVNAHCADAMVCISNCDKITPGMLNAAMRLNIPVIFVSGVAQWRLAKRRYPSTSWILVDAMVIAADSSADDATVDAYERSACPTCGSCSGMFTANSMNCLTEALGSQPAGQWVAAAPHMPTASSSFLRAGTGDRRGLAPPVVRAGRQATALPREIASRKRAFENAMTLDVAMGGSTNTILHLLAAAQEAGVDFDMAAHRHPVAQSATAVQSRTEHAALPHGGRAPRRRRDGDSWASWRAVTCCTWTARRSTRDSLGAALAQTGTSYANRALRMCGRCTRRGPPASRPSKRSVRQSQLAQHWIPTGTRAAASGKWLTPTHRRAGWRSCSATSPSSGCVVKTAGVADESLRFRGPRAYLREPGRRRQLIF